MSIRTSWLRLLKVVHRTLLWCDRRMPRGTRGAAGLVLVGLAPLGFLPVLGFWMLPVGLGMIALEVPPWRRKLLHWLPHVPITQGARLGSACLSYNGEVAFGITADHASIPDLRVFIAAVRCDLAALVAAARNKADARSSS